MKFFDFLGYAAYVAGIISGAYVGGYLMFIKPILTCLTAFDLGTLTGSMIGWTIVKCIFAGTAGCLTFGIGIIAATVFWRLSMDW